MFSNLGLKLLLQISRLNKLAAARVFQNLEIQKDRNVGGD
jgi:hypothetical protein